MTPSREAVEAAARLPIFADVFGWKRRSGPDWTAEHIVVAVIDALVEGGHYVPTEEYQRIVDMHAGAFRIAHDNQERLTRAEADLASAQALLRRYLDHHDAFRTWMDDQPTDRNVLVDVAKDSLALPEEVRAFLAGEDQ